jgi:putative SOS response-associated peptidase YedK
MCYSAQVEAAYAAYVRATGAEMDVAQFEEIFGLRLHEPSIKIPRAVDRWFERPTDAGGLKLRNLVMQHRAARIQELEAEIAKQRERLAGAEAKLATKPTKAAANDKRIATDKIETFEKRLPLYTGWEPTRLDDRIFPMQYAPIVMMVAGKPVIRLARYHCRQAGKPASIDKERDGLYNARRDNLTRYWRHEFGHQHAVMLVNSFWENVDREGRNQVLHFTPEPKTLMHVACIYAEWKDPAGGPSLLSFAAVTDEPPAEIAAAGHDRCIVNLKAENIGAWLTPGGRSVDELQALLDDKQRPFYEHRLAA